MERLSMRKIREILRLHLACGLSARRIAQSTAIGRTTVGEYLQRFNASGLSWPLPETLSDTELEQRLFPPAPKVPTEQRPVPDWHQVHTELRRPGVTQFLLWQEYKQAYPASFQYSWFCDQYRAWTRKLDVVMRQEHRAGEKLFVDYAGQTAEVVDRRTGEIRQAQIFVAVLGASSYTYAEATWTQGLADWIGAQARALAFLGGVPEIIVPDNLKSAVIRRLIGQAPVFNPRYRDFAGHFGFTIKACGVGKGNEKGRVERAIRSVRDAFFAAPKIAGTGDGGETRLQAVLGEIDEEMVAVGQTGGQGGDEMLVDLLEPRSRVGSAVGVARRVEHGRARGGRLGAPGGDLLLHRDQWRAGGRERAAASPAGFHGQGGRRHAYR